MREIRPIKWVAGKLELLDQTRLPQEQVYVVVERYQEAVEAIQSMRVRGAPAIGVTAAYAMAIAARQIGSTGRAKFLTRLNEAAAEITSARPTAVNLPLGSPAHVAGS